jgi:hypothetical protein
VRQPRLFFRYWLGQLFAGRATKENCSHAAPRSLASLLENSRPTGAVVPSARRSLRAAAVEVEAEASVPDAAPAAAAADGATADEKKAAGGAARKKGGRPPRRNVTLKLEDITVGQELQGTVVSHFE